MKQFHPSIIQLFTLFNLLQGGGESLFNKFKRKQRQEISGLQEKLDRGSVKLHGDWVTGEGVSPSGINVLWKVH